MNIFLNGEPKQVEAASISQLVLHLKLDTRKVALEKNREIISRKAYENTPIHEGDEIEIVEFIGGG